MTLREMCEDAANRSLLCICHEELQKTQSPDCPRCQHGPAVVDIMHLLAGAFAQRAVWIALNRMSSVTLINEDGSEKHRDFTSGGVRLFYVLEAVSAAERGE